MRKKIVITDYSFPDLARENEILQAAGFDVQAFQCTREEDVTDAARDASGLLVQWAPVSRKVIQQLKQCKVIVRYGIGLDNIDLEAAHEAGIMVCNAPDYCIHEVADHTVAMALSLIRQLTRVDTLIREGVWKTYPSKRLLPLEKVNFVSLGFGKIAREVLKRANIFGCRLFAYDPYVTEKEMLQVNTRKISLDEAFTIADVLSLHLPLVKETYYIVDKQRLKEMHSNAVILNTSRGALIDTIALADSLKQGLISGAGLDVFEKEPLAPDHPIRSAPNVILTSHIAWYSEESIPKLQRMAAEEILLALSSRQVRNRIV